MKAPQRSPPIHNRVQSTIMPGAVQIQQPPNRPVSQNPKTPVTTPIKYKELPLYKRTIQTKSDISMLRPTNSSVLFINGCPVRFVSRGNILYFESFSQNRFVEYKLANGNNAPARFGFTATLLPDQTMIIFGGHYQNVASSDIYQLNLKQPAWGKCQYISRPPEPRYCHATINQKNNLFVFGGTNGISMNNELVIITINGKCCSSATMTDSTNCGSWPSARCGHTLTITGENDGNKAYLFGGMESSGIISNELWELSLSGIPTFKKLIKRNSPPPRYGHIAFMQKGSFFVVGGYDEHGKQLNDIWTLDGDVWTQTKVFDVEPFIFAFNNVIYKVGNDGSVGPINEHETLKSLDDLFNSYNARISEKKALEASQSASTKMSQSAKFAELQAELAKITEIDRNLDRSNPQGVAEATKYFDQSKIIENKAKVEKLRVEYINMAVSSMAKHSEAFLVHPRPTESFSDSFIKNREAKLALLRTKNQQKLDEINIEFEISSRLLSARPNPTNVSDPAYKATLDYAIKAISLNQKQQEIARLKEKVARTEEKAVISQQKLNELMDNIAIAESQYIHEKKKIDKWNQKIHETYEMTCQAESMFRLLTSGSEAMAQQQIDEVQKKIIAANNMMKDQLTEKLSSKMVDMLRQLSGLAKMLRVSNQETNSTIKSRINEFMQLINQQSAQSPR
ncbi:hypothetical protein TRFO_36307 [Tritrichomonas foetus]|uniref:Kelch motif family protein n=1 Tax=Tritrichomonas foetus TaxID=1144522 RepID=A0A1J4JJR8_9EUKA|nr:hypothetical protein TRFO_36307 [Tritrichomonas foetus]|eukprot:OHS97484.1 hypothetical protein TRFO_36307 [Tritrichomonas foetus]